MAKKGKKFPKVMYLVRMDEGMDDEWISASKDLITAVGDEPTVVATYRLEDVKTYRREVSVIKEKK